jgi:DNA-directed RNA polymerase subunit H (RpoH/RPB5)
MDIRNFSDVNKVKKSLKILTQYLMLRYKIRSLTFPGINVLTNLPQTPINSINLCLITTDIDKPVTIIYYVADLGVKNFKSVLAWIECHHISSYLVNSVIIVYEHKTSECERHLASLTMPSATIELFALNNLQKNIFNNVLSPSIHILNDEETASLISYYSIKDKRKFPLINSTGPECKYLNIKKGELIKFTRTIHNDNSVPMNKSSVRYVI